MVGASTFAVRNWENNLAVPQPRYLPRIIKFLGYDPKVKTREFYGERIQHYLESCGISRTELAKRLSVTPQTVHKWIHNMSTPPKGLLLKLLSTLNDVPLNEKGIEL